MEETFHWFTMPDGSYRTLLIYTDCRIIIESLRSSTTSVVCKPSHTGIPPFMYTYVNREKRKTETLDTAPNSIQNHKSDVILFQWTLSNYVKINRICYSTCKKTISRVH